MTKNSNVASMLQRGPRLGRLRWRSRRGMKELDALFENYFNSSDLSDRDEASILALEHLMDCQDTDLLNWLLGHSMPQDAQLQHAVQHIRETRMAMKRPA